VGVEPHHRLAAAVQPAVIVAEVRQTLAVVGPQIRKVRTQPRQKPVTILQHKIARRHIDISPLAAPPQPGIADRTAAAKSRQGALLKSQIVAANDRYHDKRPMLDMRTRTTGTGGIPLQPSGFRRVLGRNPGKFRPQPKFFSLSSESGKIAER